MLAAEVLSNLLQLKAYFVLLFQSKEEVSGYWFLVLWVSLSSGESIFG